MSHFLESLYRDQLPDGRLPSMRDIVRAYEHPAEADPLVLDYLRKRPELGAHIRQCLKLEKESVGFEDAVL